VIDAGYRLPSEVLAIEVLAIEVLATRLNRIMLAREAAHNRSNPRGVGSSVSAIVFARAKA
jgi:hypothetical protein